MASLMAVSKRLRQNIQTLNSWWLYVLNSKKYFKTSLSKAGFMLFLLSPILLAFAVGELVGLFLLVYFIIYIIMLDAIAYSQYTCVIKEGENE